MADDDGDGVEDDRIVELSAIQAIYPELVLDSSESFSGRIDIAVEPLQALPIHFSNPTDGAPPASLDGGFDVCSLKEGSKLNGPVFEFNQTIENVEDDDSRQATQLLSYLPSLSIALLLPEGYPHEQPPIVSLSSSWIPHSTLSFLTGACRTLWEEMGREETIFAYIDYLRDAADKSFELVASGGMPFEVSGELEVTLLDFDLKMKRAKFEGETFNCGICLEPKKGSMCHRLALCSHVFCVECLQDFYGTCITEGDVSKVRCIAPKCDEVGNEKPRQVVQVNTTIRRKQDRTLEANELLQIPLAQETVQRYVKLKRKKRLESDRRTIYCPRQWCQGPSRSQKNKFKSVDAEDSDTGEDEPDYYDPNAPEKLPPPAERLAICEDCGLAFCKVCKASWHGEYYTCFPRSQFEITAEERASEDYLKLHTQACPTCNAPAQKTHGCNHMICSKCSTHFCYLCGAYLSSENPYKHYNDLKEGCYMRLWELEEGDDADIGQIFEGGLARHPELEAVEVPQVGNPRVPVPEAEVIPPRGEGQALRQQEQGPGNDRGLQRFLELVQNDEEEDWDSDEMEEIRFDPFD